MKILVVDDSRAMRLIVMRTLREAGFGHHDLLEASNGLEAFDMLLQNRFDLILCDWNMPEMTGEELLMALNNEGMDTPFGFVTTEATPSMREKAAGLGARFLISKPFTSDQFEKILSEFLA